MDFRNHDGGSFYLGDTLEPKIYRAELFKSRLLLYNVFNGSVKHDFLRSSITVDGQSISNYNTLVNKITEIVNPSASSSEVSSELSKLTDSNRPSIISLENETQIFTGFKSIEVVIVEGSGSIQVQDETAVTFPFGSSSGVSLTLDDVSSKTVTVDVTGGAANKALATLIY